MSDLVTLGIAVDSSQVKGATKDLTGLSAAARPAAVAVDSVGKASTGLGAAAAKVAPALIGATTAATGLTGATKPATQAVNAHATAHVGLSAAAQSAGHSIRSAVEGLASGVPISTVLTQQFGHLSFAATSKSGLTGAFKEAGGALLGLINPTTAVIAGAAALAGTGYALYASWKASTLALDDAARSAGTTTKSLSALQAAASFKGIDTADFTKGIANFSRGVYDAQHGMGSLAETFHANNKEASTFDQYLSGAADIIKNAGSDQQRLVLLQQMGLPPTMEWVRLLSGGAAGLQKAKDAAAAFSADSTLVAQARQFDETWNRAWANFGLNSRSAFQTALSTGSTLFDRMDRLAKQAGNSSFWDKFLPANHAEIAKGQGITTLSPFQQRFSGDSKNPASDNTTLSDGLRADADRRRNRASVDAAAEMHDLQMQQQRFGALSQVATVNEQVRQSELSLTIARNQPGNKITDSDVARIQKYTAAQALGTTAIRSSTDAQNVEAATIGMTTGNALAYAAVQNRINEERRKGNTLSGPQIDALRAEASGLAQAAQNTENLRFGYDTLTNVGQTFQQQIANGAKVMDAFKASGVSALNAISSKLMKMATDKLWESAFGGASSGGIGGLLSLFGLGGDTSGALNANGSISGAVGGTSVGGAPLIGANAAGTDNWQGGLTRVNEQGGEIMNLPGGTQIIPHDVSMAMANRVASPAAGSGGGGTTAVKVDVGVSIDQDGNLQAYVKNMSQKAASDTLTGFVKSPAFVDNVGAASRKAAGQRK